MKTVFLEGRSSFLCHYETLLALILFSLPQNVWPSGNKDVPFNIVIINIVIINII